MMSQKALRSTLIVMCTAGIGIAGYLTYVHYAGISPVCTTGGSCEKVQTSTYSLLVGIPVALIGLLGYVSILAALLMRPSETTRFVVAALTLTGFAFSAYLTYREVYSIHAICEWCVSSAIILTAMTPVAIAWFLRPAARTAAIAGVS